MFRRRIVSPVPEDEKKVKGSTYQIVELVGTSETSWEEAAKNVLETADESLRDLRIAEVSKMDITIENGKAKTFRAKVKASFKYHTLIKKIKTQERPEEVF